MQEIKIPDGCKASIDFEKRVVVIEKEFIPNDGDIIYCEYLDGDINVSWVALVKKVRHFEEKKIYIDNHALYMICTNDKSKDAPYLEIGSNQSADCDVRLATPSEQQLLFDALAKEGKKWNDTTIQIEDVQKDILVPESIGIYKHKHRLDLGLLIGFNYDSQFLGYHPFNKQWFVASEQNKYEKVQCKLIPCKREDLKKGETAFHSYSCTPSFSNIHQYSKIIDNNYHVFANSRKSVINESNEYPYWYKVEPINK